MESVDFYVMFTHNTCSLVVLNIVSQRRAIALIFNTTGTLVLSYIKF